MVAVSLDRKSTRLNSSHTLISYAVFCLKKTRASPPGSPGTSSGRGDACPPARADDHRMADGGRSTRLPERPPPPPEEPSAAPEKPKRNLRFPTAFTVLF